MSKLSESELRREEGAIQGVMREGEVSDGIMEQVREGVSKGVSE